MGNYGHYIIDVPASTFPPAIEAPQLGIMSANLTVNHPNISVWFIHEQNGIIWLKLINNSHSSLRDVCQYWDEELKIRGCSTVRNGWSVL